MKVTREQAISALQSRMDKRRSSITSFESDVRYIKHLLQDPEYYDEVWSIKHALKWTKDCLEKIVEEQHIDKFLMKYLLEDIAMERAYSCHASNTRLSKGFVVNGDGSVKQAYSKPQKIIKGPV